MIDTSTLTTIAFDADDTLWANEHLFIETQDQLKNMLSKYTSSQDIEDQLYKGQIKNLNLFGYGIKGFTLSMIETSIEITNEKITGSDIQEIINLSKNMLAHPIQLLPGVKETLLSLKEKYQLIIITKGDLFDQESKIARSGIAELFEHIEIISDKNIHSYQKILTKYKIDPKKFLMVGNSLKSDILPVCSLGAYACHIPFQTTWAHEMISQEEMDKLGYIELSNISSLKKHLTKLQSDT